MSEGIFKYSPKKSAKQLIQASLTFNNDEKHKLTETLVDVLDRIVRENVGQVVAGTELCLPKVDDHTSEKEPLTVAVVSGTEGELSRHDLTAVIEAAMRKCKQSGEGAEGLEALSKRLRAYADFTAQAAEIGLRVRAEREEEAED